MPDPSNEEWFRRTLDWPLTAESVVVEVGGYEGRWAQEIACLYSPRLYVYEPQQWAFRRILQRFRRLRLSRPFVFNYGLGECDRADAPMGAWHTDGASFLKPPDEGGGGRGRLRRAADALAELGIDGIDLMQINVEGYEARLVPHLAETGWLAKTRWLVIQLHGAIRAELEMVLAPTHRLLWSGAFDAWERK